MQRVKDNRPLVFPHTLDMRRFLPHEQHATCTFV